MMSAQDMLEYKLKKKLCVSVYISSTSLFLNSKSMLPASLFLLRPAYH